MTTIFGNPGSTELTFFKHWPADFRYVLALQEASAVAMADGYAQMTHNTAFINLHSAIGLGHSLGSVFTAYRNQSPLVIVAGQQARSMLLDEPFLGAKEAAEFPKPYVKWSCEPARAQDVPAAIARAYHFAMQPPCGPTFISVPVDDWDAAAEPLEPHKVSYTVAPDPLALQQVADAMNHSERPALVVGPEVDRAGAWEVVITLAERTCSAVWVSPFSSRCSFPEDHAQFAGFLQAERRQVAEILGKYDVVVVLGAPVFTYHVESTGPILPPDTQLFQLTGDPEAAAWSPVGSSLVTNVRLGIEQLLSLITISTRLSPVPRQLPVGPPMHDPMSINWVLHTISQMMPLDAIIVEEIPSHRNAMHEYLPIHTSHGFFTCASGGLGFSLPAAVGIALAEPSRRVIALVGDGSSQYTIQALWTAAQHQLSMTFLIINNGGYGAMRAFSKLFAAQGFPGVDLPGVDMLALARGYGVTAARVEHSCDLATALQKAFASTGPELVDIIVDPEVPVLY
jgi:benzoylformate decarboxylase